MPATVPTALSPGAVGPYSSLLSPSVRPLPLFAPHVLADPHPHPCRCCLPASGGSGRGRHAPRSTLSRSTAVPDLSASGALPIPDSRMNGGAHRPRGPHSPRSGTPPSRRVRTDANDCETAPGRASRLQSAGASSGRPCVRSSHRSPCRGAAWWFLPPCGRSTCRSRPRAAPSSSGWASTAAWSWPYSSQ